MRLQWGSTALSSGRPGTQAQPRTQGHSWDFTFGCGEGQGDLSNKILEDEEWASLKMDVFFKTCRCTGRRGYETHVNTSPPSPPASFLLSFCFHLLFKKISFQLWMCASVWSTFTWERVGGLLRADAPSIPGAGVIGIFGTGNQVGVMYKRSTCS